MKEIKFRLKQLGRKDLLLVFVYINVFCKSIGLDNSSDVYLVLIFIGTIALSIKIAGDKFNKNEAYLVLCMILIGVGSFLVTQKPTLLLSSLCLAGIKNVDIDRVFSGMFAIRLITFLSLISLALFGAIDNKSIEMWRDGTVDVRYSLGFPHPNTLHLSLFILVAIYIYIRYSKIRTINIFILCIFNYFIYLYSISRTGFVAVFILIFLFIVSKINNVTITNIILKTPKYIFAIMVVLSFSTGLLYDNFELIKDWDSALNGRIAYAYHYLNNYGFSLLGNRLVAENTALDNGYIYMFVQFGILGFGLLTILFLQTCKHIEKTQDISKAILLQVFFIYLYTESFTPNIFMNVILFFAAPTIFKTLRR